jgi:hypothetical protein
MMANADRSRHPELVSGSNSRISRVVSVARWMLSRKATEGKLVQHDGLRDRVSASNRRQAQIHRQIHPLRILRFNQFDLPWTVPVFQLLLTRYCIFNIIKYFKTNETMNSIFRRVTGRKIVAVLMKAFQQIGSHANIQRSIWLTGQYIDARLLGFPHSRFIGSPWTLKQVQGDAFGGIGRY